jgi:hypothetical protein
LPIFIKPKMEKGCQNHRGALQVELEKASHGCSETAFLSPEKDISRPPEEGSR